MLVQEYFTREYDGEQMVKHYSDLEYHGVQNVETLDIYEVAIDPVRMNRQYREVEIPRPE